MAASKLPNPMEWEVLVVDNGSTDRTRDLVEEFCRRYPNRFRYFLEARQGKSYALNSGVRHARGDVLVFTDDDVTVDPAWLHRMSSVFQEGKWAGASGRTLPAPGFVPPKWLNMRDRYAWGALAMFDRGLCPGYLDEAPFGNNMAYRREVFDRYDCFRTDLGPLPDVREPQKGEDSEFGSRLLTAGESLRYEPRALVYHAIPESKARQAYFFRWWFDKARADVRISGSQLNHKWKVLGIALVGFRRIVIWAIRWLFSAHPATRFECKVSICVNAGWITESYRRVRRGSILNRQRHPGPGDPSVDERPNPI